MTQFTQDILTVGLATTANPDEWNNLRAVAKQLEVAGHSVQLVEDYLHDKMTRLTVHHYRTCRVCSKHPVISPAGGRS
jgi:hypothetical protein